MSFFGTNLIPTNRINSIERRVQTIEGRLKAIRTMQSPPSLNPGFSTQTSSLHSQSMKKAPFAFYLQPNTASTTTGLLKRKEAVLPLVQSASQQHNVDKDLVMALIQQESGFQPDALSKAGATGLMQLMPKTAKELGVNNIYDPQENIEAGTRYLKSLLNQFNQNIPVALAAYNAGPSTVKHHNGIPPYKETQQYVRHVLSNYLHNKQE